MSMLEPDRGQERPSAADVRRMWGELRITHEPLSHPALDELLRRLRETHVNGGAEFAQFGLSGHPTLHWFGSRNRLDEADFFGRLLSSRAVASALPTLRAGEPGLSAPEFWRGSPLTLDGEIAQVLLGGGAYVNFGGRPEEAKEIGSRFCEAVFGDRYAEVLVYKSHKPWSPWFYDVAWDVTWLGFDKRHARVWLLCVTDTD